MFTPTTHIKIIDEKNMIKKQPDYALILSWHYGKSVMKNLRKKGYKGKFIIPLPSPKIMKYIRSLKKSDLKLKILFESIFKLF